MKTFGIIRKLDELGRVVIPMEMRRSLAWETGTPIQITATGDIVHLEAVDKTLDVDGAIRELTGVQFKDDNQQIAYNAHLLALKDILNEVDA